MVKEELVSRSPVRIFMKSIHGGLAAGEVGLIASPRGLGKTSVLVQIALDKLLQGKKVIHVSFTQHADYVLAWYENIFGEFTQKKNLEDEEAVRDEVVKNRVLMKFTQDGVSSAQILRSLRAMIADGGFAAECVIVDGYRFSPADGDRIRQVKDFARELGLSVWYSCTVTGDVPYDKRGIPLVVAGYADLFDVVIALEPRQDHIALRVSRDREVYNPTEMALRLDPRTLLILEE